MGALNLFDPFFEVLFDQKEACTNKKRTRQQKTPNEYESTRHVKEIIIFYLDPPGDKRKVKNDKGWGG